jgi:hypothetical protein
MQIQNKNENCVSFWHSKLFVSWFSSKLFQIHKNVLCGFILFWSTEIRETKTGKRIKLSHKIQQNQKKNHKNE